MTHGKSGNSNARYKEIIEKFTYLNGIKMQDVDEKPELPVHLILGASENAKIKTETRPRVGKPETMLQSSPILVGPLSHLKVKWTCQTCS
jgi:hypothetical protein